MDAKVEPAMKNPRQLHPPLSPTFSSLPDDIVVNCLARVSRSYYRTLSQVSKSFRSLISSPDLYVARSHIGATEPYFYVCLRSPTSHLWFTLDQTLITNGGEIKDELTLVPIKFSPSNSPAIVKSTAVAVGSEIYQIGGTIYGKYSSTVHVFDCRSHTWRDAPSMRVERLYAKSWFLDGKIYVTGGCRTTKEEPKNWGEVFDLTTQTWKSLPSPNGDPDGFDQDHQAVFLEGKVYIITKDYKYAYDPKKGKWVFEEMFVDQEDYMTTRWCVIDDVMFIDGDSEYMWYDSWSGEWFYVYGLEDLYVKRSERSSTYSTYDLFNYGGKLGIVWVEWIETLRQWSGVWCAVIRLEKRLSSFGLEIWGVIERCNIVVPSNRSSYTYLTCLAVSV